MINDEAENDATQLLGRNVAITALKESETKLNWG